MGKAIRRRQEARASRQPNFPSILQRSSRDHAKKAAERAAFDPLTVIRGFESRAIRPLDQFVPRTRSLNQHTRVRELVRYAFNQYSPPGFLYEVWGGQDTYGDYLFGFKEDFRLWYLALAQGHSLYKECTMGLLTKKETHHFSTCSYALTVPQAIWYAVIRGMEAPEVLARKLASTRLAQFALNDFWKAVARWFIRYPTSVRQTNDLLDYISARHNEHPDWYLKDRTLSGLQRAMQSWHRELHRVSSMSVRFTRWPGIQVEDSVFERGQGKKRTLWRFHQITTGKELAEEGNKQHHCVSSYGQWCAQGRCSIWSMTAENMGNCQRALTIEVRNAAEREIVQARGYANRSPKAEELSMLKEWAGKYGFRLGRWL